MSITLEAQEATQETWLDTQPKTFERWGHEVHGWHKSVGTLQSRPGVFMVATKVMGQPCMLAVEEAHDVHARLSQHEGERIWRTLATGGLMYAAIYTDGEGSRFVDSFMRETLADHIRTLEQPICGVNDVLA